MSLRALVSACYEYPLLHCCTYRIVTRSSTTYTTSSTNSYQVYIRYRPGESATLDSRKLPCHAQDNMTRHITAPGDEFQGRFCPKAVGVLYSKRNENGVRNIWTTAFQAFQRRLDRPAFQAFQRRLARRSLSPRRRGNQLLIC